MSEYIENQVVEMEFDNRDFEKNVATSLKTLDTLKEKLKFENASKGFYEIQNGLNSINFTPFLGQLDSMESQFTSFIGRLELSVKDFLGSQVINEFMQLFNNTLGQIQSGGRSRAMNIEQAQFKIKGLKKDWDEVYKDMDYAVSGTAYGIDQAANAAAQFLASNIQTGDDMKAALRGISGIAAMTSSSYDEIARVFTAAAGKGRVMALELNRISLRGVNAAAALAEYLGTTEAAVRKMASKGEIDFVTFAKAMDTAFGEHAKKANETFSGSLANVRAALSRIGEIYYEPWIREMIPWFNEIRKAIDNVKNALKTAFGGIEGNTFANTLKNLLLEIGKLKVALLKSFAPTVDQVAKKVEFWNDKLAKLTATLRGVTAAVEKYAKKRELLNKKTTTTTDSADGTGVGSSDDVERTFAGITTTIAGTAITLDKEVGATVASIIDRYNALYNSQKNILQSTVNLFSKWSYTYKTSFKTLNKNLKSNKWGLEKLATDMAKLESKGVLSDAFIQNLKNMGTSGAEIVHALAQANDKDLKEYMKTWETTNGMFDTIAKDWTKEAKQEAEKSLNEITGIPNATMEDYMKTYDEMFKQMGISSANGYQVGFENTFAGMEEVFNKQIEAIEAYKQALDSANESKDESSNKKYAQTFRDAYNTIDNTIKKIREYAWVETLIGRISRIFETAGNIIHTVSTSIYTALESVASAFGDVWTEFNVVDGVAIEGPIQKILNLIQKVVTNFEISGERAELIKSIFKGVFSVFELGKWVINNLLDAITPLVDKLTSGEPIFLRVAGALGEFIHSVVAAIINGDSIGNSFKNLLTSFKGFFNGLLDLLFGDGDNVISTTNNIFTFIKDTFSKIITFVSDIFSNPNDEISGGGFGEFLRKLFTEVINVDSIFNKIKEIFSGLGDGFGTIWGVINSLLGYVPEVFDFIWSILKQNGQAISDFFSAFLGFFTKIFSEGSKENGTLEKIGDVIVSALTLVETIFTSLSSTITAVQGPLESIVNNLLKLFDHFTSMLNEIFDWVGEDVERAYGAAAFFVLMDVIKAFKKTAPVLTKLLDKLTPGLKGLVGSMTNFFKTASNGINNLTAPKDIFDKVRSIAVSFAIIAAGILLLGLAFSTDDGKFNEGALYGIIIAFTFLGTFVAIVAAFSESAKAHPLVITAIAKVFTSIGALIILTGIGFKLIASSIDNEHPENSLYAIGALAVIIVGMLVAVGMLVHAMDKQTTPMIAKNIKAIALVIFAIGIAISGVLNSISFMILTIAAIMAASKGKADIETLVVATVGILALIMLFIGGILFIATKEKNTDYKGLIGLSIFIIAFTAALGGVVAEFAGLMLAIGLVKGNGALRALGIIVALMVMIGAVVVAVAALSKQGGKSILLAALGLTVFLNALTGCMAAIAGLVVLFHSQHVTSDDVKNVLAVLGVLALIIGIFTAGAAIAGAALPASAVGVITAISVSFFLIAASFSLLAIAVAKVVKTFKELAYAWPDIKDILPDMVKDLKELLPDIIDLIGEGIRKLAGQIIISAPIIAAAIFTVMTTLFTLMMQKAPAHALAILIVIDEILTIIVAGAGIIVNKLLFILVIVLEALNANAYILGYQLTMILIKVIQGAFEALVEVVVEGWKQIWDEVLSDFFEWLQYNPLAEAISNFTWALLHGESFEDTEAEEDLLKLGDWYKDVDGKWKQIKTEEDRVAATINKMAAGNKVLQSAKEFKEEFDKNTDEIDKTMEDADYTEGWDFESWKDYDNNTRLSKAKNQLMNDSVENELKKNGYEIPDSVIEEATNTGAVIGGTIVSSEAGAMQSSESETVIADSITSIGESDEVKSASEGVGGKIFGWITDKIKSSTKDNKGAKSLAKTIAGEDGDITKSLGFKLDTSNMNTDEVLDAVTNLDAYGDGTVAPELNIPVSTVDENGNPINSNSFLQDGINEQTANIDVENPQITRQNELLTSLETLVGALNEQLNDVIIMPKNAKLDITTAIDGVRLGRSMYPIISSFDKETAVLTESAIAAPWGWQRK